MRRAQVLVLPFLAAACGSLARGDAGDAGTQDAGAEPSMDVAPPRPIAPVSVSFTNTRQPTFRWRLADGSDGARVDVCRDRACTQVFTTFAAKGDRGAPAEDLPIGVVFWRLHGTAGDASGASMSPTWELVVPRTSAAREMTWGAMLDANGDGYADVAVGDSDFFSATENVYVHDGGPQGPASAPSTVLAAPQPIESYARSIASAGDVDGDGYGDFLVGSPKESTVYVYRGGPSGFTAAPALHGPPGSGFGASVARAGDIDEDGYADVVVGMPQVTAAAGSGGSGEAMVLYGGAAGLSLAHATPLVPASGAQGSSFGQFVAGAGDIYGDGRSNVAVWAGVEPTAPFEIALFRGADTNFGQSPSTRLKFDGSSVTWLGAAIMLTCAGDVNGDGYADLVMSSAYPPNLGSNEDHLSLFLGHPPAPAAYPTVRISNPFGMTADFGLSVAALDANGDGFGDVAVAASSGTPPGPSAVVYAGTPLGIGARTVIPTSELSTVEHEISSVGDVDGDGYADLLLGSPSRVTGGGAGKGPGLHGAVDVYSAGPAGIATTAHWTLLPPDENAVAYGASLPSQ